MKRRQRTKVMTKMHFSMIICNNFTKDRSTYIVSAVAYATQFFSLHDYAYEPIILSFTIVIATTTE